MPINAYNIPQTIGKAIGLGAKLGFIKSLYKLLELPANSEDNPPTKIGIAIKIIKFKIFFIIHPFNFSLFIFLKNILFFY